MLYGKCKLKKKNQKNNTGQIAQFEKRLQGKQNLVCLTLISPRGRRDSCVKPP